MSQAADGDAQIESGDWPAGFDEVIRGSQTWLAERGEMIVGSGCFRSGQLSGSVYTDFGPEDQDKDANQDYALVWVPRDEAVRERLRLVVAMGDGLTTSYRSEWAAALVCSVALRALVEGDSALTGCLDGVNRWGGSCTATPASPAIPGVAVQLPPQPTVQLPPQPTVQLPPQPTVQLPPQPTVQLPPQPTVQLPPQPTVQLPPQPGVAFGQTLRAEELARRAFNVAGESLGRLAEELAREPEASCPAGQFLSTWKYILRKGLLLQSTLTLAWLDRRFLYVAMIGDGGGVWRGYGASPGAGRADDRVLAECDLARHQVRALGPAERNLREFDCWRQQELHGRFLCVLHTDGIGRGMGGKPLRLLDEMEELRGAGENAARRFIERAIEERPQDFDDNLTLAVIEGE